MRDIVKKSIKLCLVTDRQNRSHQWLASLVKSAVIGGVTMVQLREKGNISYSEFIDIAHLLLSTLSPFKVPLIINDHVDICQAVNAQGVHLGQNDMHPNIARKILGNSAIIGLSLESMDEVHSANNLNSINYVAASHIFVSQTKPEKTNLHNLDCWGFEGLKRLKLLSKHPIISIGGINLTNITDVIKSGSDGVAVVSAISESSCPRSAALNLIHKINKGISDEK